jgi:prepilin-type processing-associated H-X9-DG protein
MKQVVLGLHNYNDTNQQLPPAAYIGPGVGYNNEGSVGPSWLVVLLPYVEQDNLFRTYQPNVQNYIAWQQSNGVTGSNDQNWRPIATSVVKVYQCPSDPQLNNPFTRLNNISWTRSSYAANSGPASGGGSQNGASPNLTVSGTTFAAGGVMSWNYGDSVAGLSVEDGTSNTIMVNHVRAGLSNQDPRGVWALGMYGASIAGGCPVGDCFGPNDTGDNADDVVGCVNNKQQSMGCWNGGYGQANGRASHSGGINVALGDGSVRFVRNSVSLLTWALMQSRNDGLTWSDN